MPDPELSDAEDLRASLDAAFEAPSSEPAAEEISPSAGEDASKDTRPRDDKGRFAAKDGSPGEGDQKPDGDNQAAADKAARPDKSAEPPLADKPAAKVADLQPENATQQPAATSAAPPPGWSISAKAAWDKLDPAVREAVAKRETEISTGLAKLADYKGLDDHASLAKQHGTTIKDALDRYIGIERALQSQPIPAILSICRDIGLDTKALASAIMGTTAAPPGDQKPGEQPPAGKQPSGPDPAVADLQRRLEALTNSINGERQNSIQAELAAFAAKPEHRYFENVRAGMAALMQSGAAADLETAYEQACWANPEIRAALISERSQKEREEAERIKAEAASKARQAARSVNGSPGGIVPGVPERGLREELEANFS